jgi:hypothetical protein
MVGALAFCVVHLLAPATARAEDQPLQDEEEFKPFVYTDDWALVSAPPPPGPYQSVNIDPRVPGQDAAPPMTIEPPPVTPPPGMPAAVDIQPPAPPDKQTDSPLDIPEAASFPGHSPPVGKQPSVAGDHEPTIPEAAPFAGHSLPAGKQPPMAGDREPTIPEAAPFAGYSSSAGKQPPAAGPYGRRRPGAGLSPEYPPAAGKQVPVTGPYGRRMPEKAGPFPEYPPAAGKQPPMAGPYGRRMPEKAGPFPEYQSPMSLPYDKGMPGRRPLYTYPDYPVPGNYPGQRDYPGYRNVPRGGPYGEGRRLPAEEVPPPSVYDAITDRP